jgi:hypothetical protein
VFLRDLSAFLSNSGLLARVAISIPGERWPTEPPRWLLSGTAEIYRCPSSAYSPTNPGTDLFFSVAQFRAVSQLSLPHLYYFFPLLSIFCLRIKKKSKQKL